MKQTKMRSLVAGGACLLALALPAAAAADLTPTVSDLTPTSGVLGNLTAGAPAPPSGATSVTLQDGTTLQGAWEQSDDGSAGCVLASWNQAPATAGEDDFDCAGDSEVGLGDLVPNAEYEIAANQYWETVFAESDVQADDQGANVVPWGAGLSCSGTYCLMTDSGHVLVLDCDGTNCYEPNGTQITDGSTEFTTPTASVLAEYRRAEVASGIPIWDVPSSAVKQYNVAPVAKPKPVTKPKPVKKAKPVKKHKPVRHHKKHKPVKKSKRASA